MSIFCEYENAEEAITKLHKELGQKDFEKPQAIIEIAGRDSIAAAVKALSNGFFRSAIPSIAFTGTEYGKSAVLKNAINVLESAMKGTNCDVLDAVYQGYPDWWHAVIGKHNSILSEKYGTWHICVGCHMYLHATRIILAKILNCDTIIAGERRHHKGKVKVNQTPLALSAYKKVMTAYDIELLLPVYELDEEIEIRNLAGNWDEGEGQLSCVLSGNNRNLQGYAEFSEERLQMYLHDYLIPVTLSVLDELLSNGSSDFYSNARNYL